MEHKFCYVLYRGKKCCGVYSSKEQLKEGVDFWINLMTSHAVDVVHMTYEVFIENGQDGYCYWDWAYIPHETDPAVLDKIGGIVPQVFDVNLIDVNVID